MQTTIYEAIGTPRRREVCQYLESTEDTPVTLEEVATHVAMDKQTERDSPVTERESSRRILIELHHQHLPKLADAAVLQYEFDRKLLNAGSKLPAAIELIESVQGAAGNVAPNP